MGLVLCRFSGQRQNVDDKSDSQTFETDVLATDPDVETSLVGLGTLVMADCSEKPAAVFATLAVGSALKFGACLFLNRCRRQPAAQSDGFVLVGRVSQLWCFPIKSFRGFHIEEGECTKLGMKSSGVTDRHFTVATANGVYLTQRQEPTMALIAVNVRDDKIYLSAPGMEIISIPTNPPVSPDRLRRVTVKADTMTSLDCGDEVAEWLCGYFKREGLRLHFSAPGLDKRDSHNNLKPWPHLALPGDLMAYPDNCPYNVLSNASLRSLNQRLKKPVTVNNFRPNIVVEGCTAFAEDEWTAIRIRDVTLRAIDHCARCIMVTVDPEKGRKDEAEEPLTTLKKFRLREPYGSKPAFGVNYALDKTGVIRVGDPVYARIGRIRVLPKTPAASVSRNC